MLIEFSVANFRSFKDRQTFSMVASSGQEMRGTHCIESHVKGVPDLLRSAAIHGPNAGGKSNLLEAMWTMRQLIVPDNVSQISELVIPFQLCKKAREMPSEFEVTFLKDETRYQYGFKVDKERFHEEWLVAYPSGRAQLWFQRTFDPAVGDYKFSFSDKFKGQKSVYKTATRADALFLTTAVLLNNKQLAIPFEWINFMWRMLDQTRPLHAFNTINLCEEKNDIHRIKQFLNAADLSVLNLQFREKKVDYPENIPSDLKRMLSKEAVLIHGVKDNSFELPLKKDSQGTQKLFSLVGPLLDVFDNGYVLVIDELCNSMHPLLLRHIVSQFHQPSCKAQLVFTNHDVTLMDPELLRRDQIWFVSKNEELASELYPLSDYHPRKSEAISKGYLQGRYGALPFLSEVGSV